MNRLEDSLDEAFRRICISLILTYEAPALVYNPHYTCVQDAESSGEVKLPLIKHHSLKTCAEVNIQLHVFLTSTPDIDINLMDQSLYSAERSPSRHNSWLIRPQELVWIKQRC
jgi:hypothetical protein